MYENENSKQLLNQIIAAIRLHRQWNGGEWIYNSMTREYIIYLNNLCDNLELEKQ
jgi:hypothetical protein